MDYGRKVMHLDERRRRGELIDDSTSARGHNMPLVYACSGSSSAAQMANYIARELDRRGMAEMSCIAGIGGDVPHLVNVATSGRPIIALDGCPLNCVKSCLGRHELTPTMHHVLSDYGARKRSRADFEREEAERILARVAKEIA